MPPANSLANSPTRRTDNPTSPPSVSPILTPALRSSTRLPIIRGNGEDDGANDVSLSPSDWRTRLERAINQVSDVPPGAFHAHRRSISDENPHHLLERTARAVEAINASNMSTYRGWAPGTIEHERPVANSNQRHHSNLSSSTATRRYRREQEVTPPLRVTNPQSITEDTEDDDVMAWEPSRRRAPDTHSNTNSLRHTALLQSVRSRARLEMMTERISNFTAARHEEEMRQRLRALQRSEERMDEAYAALMSRDQDESGVTDKEITKLFEANIIVLDGLRSCITKEDRVALLRESMLAPARWADGAADELNIDTSTIMKPSPTSWLRPGAVFHGQQKTATSSATIRLRQSSRRRQIEQQTQEALLQSGDASQTWRNRVVSAGTPEQNDESWPVKVSITSIDYDNMTLTGIMEAFNVPNARGTSHIKDPKVTSITTYLEGEIIDFHKHALRTTSFKAGADTDAQYWRKLQPFKDLGPKEILGGLISTKWINKHISQEWIVMRWKERCFISPSDVNSGLTISGFYYITLRRSDGKLEGLYHDPQSCPYQHLRLSPSQPSFPIYNFR